MNHSVRELLQIISVYRAHPEVVGLAAAIADRCLSIGSAPDDAEMQQVQQAIDAAKKD